MYELKDHLGNVRVTFSDIKMPTGSGSQPFMVDFLSKSEYYPYGMEITGLSWNTGNNRYGFGGTHEMDNEVKGGVGKHLSFGEFGYDTRVARRFNLDPYKEKFPFLSNYSAFSLDPINRVDPTGKTDYWYSDFKGDYQCIDDNIPNGESRITTYENLVNSIEKREFNFDVLNGFSYPLMDNLTWENIHSSYYNDKILLNKYNFLELGGAYGFNNNASKFINGGMGKIIFHNDITYSSSGVQSNKAINELLNDGYNNIMMIHNHPNPKNSHNFAQEPDPNDYNYLPTNIVVGGLLLTLENLYFYNNDAKQTIKVSLTDFRTLIKTISK